MRSSPYTIAHEVPSTETYRALRKATGLSPKTLQAAERGLAKAVMREIAAWIDREVPERRPASPSPRRRASGWV